MIDNSSSSSSTKRIRVTKVLELQTIFDSKWFKRIEIIIKEFKEIFSFEIQCLEGHPPLRENGIALMFFTKIPR